MGYTPHVLVVGGGVTGTAIARDLAIRGLEVTLLERDSLASGATGWVETLLQSGAGHAATDPELARRCHREGQILRETAGHCIDDTGGLLVDREDDEAFERTLEACRECEIPVDELASDEIRAVEPSLSPEVDRAARIPDAAVDPFRLALDTARDAESHGATIRTHTEVTDVLVEDGSVVGVTVQSAQPTMTDGGVAAPVAAPGRSFGGRDAEKQRPGESSSEARYERDSHGEQTRQRGRHGRSSAMRTGTHTSDEIRADYIVNAAGGHAGAIASMAGFDLPLAFHRTTVVLSDAEATGMVVRRISDSGEQRVVPAGSMSVLGTAVDTVDGPDDETELSHAVESILAELPDTVPEIDTTPLPRAEWGVRTDLTTADISGGVRIDHAKYHDTWGIVTVVGARLTTHRHLAERVTDHICGEFGITRECKTDELPLRNWGGVQRAFEQFTGDTARTGDNGETEPVICPCLGVRRDEIHEAIDDAGTPTDLNDVRIRTGASAGVCQGGRCAHRMATQLYPGEDRFGVESALDGLLEERWRGQRYTLWGDQLRRAMETYLLHRETMDRTAPDASSLDLSRFSDGQEATDDRPTHCLRGPR